MGNRVNRRTELRDPNHHESHPVHKRLGSLQTEPKGTVDLLWFNSIISEQQPSLLRQRTCDVPTGEEDTAFANSLQQSQHTCAVEPQARALVLPLSNASPGCNVIVENVDPAFFQILARCLRNRPSRRLLGACVVHRLASLGLHSCVTNRVWRRARSGTGA